MILKIKGDIVNDDVKRAVNYLRSWGLALVGDYFAPMDLVAALNEMPKGDRLEVKINSGGGDVMAGQEIYTMLRGRNDVDIEVESIAASAASVIAMAGPSTISPVGMVMIHDVSTYGASGNHQDFEKLADTLKRYDEALAGAYVAKTGKPKAEIIRLMDEETWLPADKAVKLGFIDKIKDQDDGCMVAGIGPIGQYDDIIKQAQELKAKKDAEEQELKAKQEAEAKAREELKNSILTDLDTFGA